MWNPRQEILEAVATTCSKVGELAADECQRIRTAILSKYTNGLRAWPTWIWEHFKAAETLVDPDAWRWIGEFCTGREAVLGFGQDEPSMFHFEDGRQVAIVLAECCNFEFFLTNRGVDFVLCHNHHECVIATGAAMEWLAAVRRGKEK